MLNFARGEIADEIGDPVAALAAGKLTAYVCDFPSRRLIGNDKVIALPHLGASTAGGGSQLCRDGGRYPAGLPGERPHPALGEFPGCRSAAHGRAPHHHRQRQRAEHGRADIHSPWRCRAEYRRSAEQVAGNLAYTIVDLDGAPSTEVAGGIRGIDGVLCVRDLGRPRAA